MTAVLLTLRFLLELALLAAFAVGGWSLTDTMWTQLLLAALLPLIAAFVWGLLLSPKAKFVFPLPIRVAIELLLFVAASALLWSAGSAIAAAALLVTELVVVLSLVAARTAPGTDVWLFPDPRGQA
ncbi:MAG: DUF2568 domain-containing protein [Actinomycetes bacterium]